LFLLADEERLVSTLAESTLSTLVESVLSESTLPESEDKLRFLLSDKDELPSTLAESALLESEDKLRFFRFAKTFNPFCLRGLFTAIGFLTAVTDRFL
jgi:hypothetical protein